MSNMLKSNVLTFLQGNLCILMPSRINKDLEVAPCHALTTHMELSIKEGGKENIKVCKPRETQPQEEIKSMLSPHKGEPAFYSESSHSVP